MWTTATVLIACAGAGCIAALCEHEELAALCAIGAALCYKYGSF